jgi:hypothetical protein
MGAIFIFLFGEKDAVLVDEIAKVHKVDKAVVEKHYKKMLEEIKNEVSK